MRTLYYNGNIVTMDGGKVVNTVLTEDGVIKIAGNIPSVDAIPDGAVNKVDLKGATMLPAFIDAHSHITAVAQTLSLADLSAARSCADIVDILKEYGRKKGLGADDWIVGYNYDHNALSGGKHPTAGDLDAIENPVCVTHKSGHMGVFNSRAVELLGAKGGNNGYFEEQAFLAASAAMPAAPEQAMLSAIAEAEKIYFRNGIVTIQDGLTNGSRLELLKKAKLTADVVCYVDYREKSLLEENGGYLGAYRDNLKIGGYKLILDGSPQAKTAWMSRPYSGETTFRGTPYYTDVRVKEAMKDAVGNGIQMLCHCNGDEASEQFIRETYHAMNELKTDADTRPVMIHAQTVRADQIRRMADLYMIPSFFVSHIFHWGDVHSANLGAQRARKISPVRSAIDYGLPFTLHQDSPVLPPDMLELIWCAANRLTKSGVKLGEYEEVSGYEALEGITCNAAYQYFEENVKGSISEGKYADFTVLSGDPSICPPENIKNIEVLKTIKRDAVVYEK